MKTILYCKFILFCLVVILTCFFIPKTAFANTFIAIPGAVDWNNASSWNVGGLIATTTPSIVDDVVINPGSNVSLNSGTASCNTISLMGTNTGTSANFSQLSIGASVLEPGVLKPGVLTVAGNITAGGTDSQVIFSDAGVLNVGGNFMTGTPGTFTYATGSKVNYNGSANQDVGLYSYYNLIISNAGVKTLRGSDGFVVHGKMKTGPGTSLVFGDPYTPVSSSVALSSSSNPSVSGSQVIFIANVTGSGGTPTGTVDFQDIIGTASPSDLGVFAVNALGKASLSISSLAIGDHAHSCKFFRNNQFNSSSSSVVQTVNPTPTPTPSPSPSPSPTPTPTPSPTPVSGGGGGGGGGGNVLLPTSTPTTTCKFADINCDGSIDELDFSIMMSQWGQAGTSLTADLNHDGTVDDLDFSILMANWGL